jgi:RNA polymerase sigma factor (sigma-70 family)
MRSGKPDLPLRGDEGELFRRHYRRLVRLVRNDVGAPEAVAEDAVCFAFLQLCRRQPGRERIVGWLRVVARHEALRLLRKQWGCVSLDEARAERRDEQTGEAAPLFERIPAPVEVDLASEAREAVRTLAGPRWRRRRVLALRAAGYSYKEIAQMLR